jgi:uroporphyrinogen decarboxylase
MPTPKERVYRAVAHEETDIVPYDILINPRAHKRLTEVYGESFDKDIANHIVGVPVDIRTFPPENVVGDWEDDFGCVWRQSRDGAPHVVKHALSRPSLKGYEFPDFSGAERYRDIPKALEVNKDEFTVIGLGVAFFERSWALRGRY